MYLSRQKAAPRDSLLDASALGAAAPIELLRFCKRMSGPLSSKDSGTDCLEVETVRNNGTSRTKSSSLHKQTGYGQSYKRIPIF